MIVLDVNVLVPAWHDGAPDHERSRAFLEETVNGTEAVGVSDAILVGAVRVLTHPRVFSSPATPQEAVAAVRGLVDHANVHVLSTTSSQWDLTADLVTASQSRGNLVADASHAAHAMSHGATLISHDRDFARFPRLNHRAPW